MISVYTKKTQIELSARRLEALEKYNKIIAYGRKNPVWFIENILGCQLLDYQKYIIMGTWVAEKAVWTCSRNAGKTFVGALYVMARNILFPSMETWMMSLTAAQSQGLFMKMESIAKGNIASIVGTNMVFWNETVKSQSNSDGFVHDKQSFRTTLFNGSTITSLVGRPESIVGKRSNLNIYDEAGKITDDFFALTEPFTTQDANFRTGANVDLTVYPKMLPTQCVYMSSAEDTNSYLWKMYKTAARAMAMGRKDMFVVDVNCEVPLHPTLNGKPYPSLFKKSEVDNMMRTNEQRALREYYNIFDTTGGTDALVTRDVILRNQSTYLPVFSNISPGDGTKYGIFYDPALQADNSFALVMHFYRDPEKGWKGRVINGINLLEYFPNGDKRTLRSTEQLAWIRRLMLDYNGKDAPEYDNLHLFIDPGSGGGGRIYTDFLMMGWTDKSGRKHKGVIDMDDETSALEAAKFPEAQKGVLRVLNSQKYKNEMFAALAEALTQDLIEFPEDTPGNGKLEIGNKKYTLTKDEIRALVEIDLTKTEILAMKKTKTPAGNVVYSLPADKSRKMHDDRCYCAAAAAYYLMQLRHDDDFNIDIPRQDFSVLTKGPAHLEGEKKSKNPFAGRTNPFARKKFR